MYVVYGSALTAGAIVLVALLTLLFANPAAPRWTRRELVAQLASVVVTVTLGMGLGCLLFLAPQQIKAEGLTLAEVAALGGALALIVLVLRALKVGTRVRAYRASGLAIPTVVPPAA